VWLSSGAQAVSEGFEDRIVIACDESCLKHHVPQQSSSTTNGPFAVTAQHVGLKNMVD